jgi:antitoxin ParD1/3/4
MQAAEKLSITLPSEMANFIRQKVDSGLYGSNSEIIREALRGMMERERRLERLDSAIARGVADAEAGRVQDIDEVRSEMRNRFDTNSEGSPA